MDEAAGVLSLMLMSSIQWKAAGRSIADLKDTLFATSDDTPLLKVNKYSSADGKEKTAKLSSRCNLMNKLKCFVSSITWLFFIDSASASDATDCISQLFKEHKQIVSMLDEGSYDDGYALAQAAYGRGNRLAGHEICKLPLIPRHKGRVGSVEASAKVCRTLAMTDDPIMQEAYARILNSGLIEPKHKNDEVYFTKQAALGGMSWAQGKLAIRYGRGEGVPKDYVQSYVFGSLAYSQGFEPIKAVVDLLEANLPQQTILEAQRMAREFVPRSGYRQFKGEIDCAK